MITKNKLFGVVFWVLGNFIALCFFGCGESSTKINFETIERGFNSGIVLKTAKVIKIDNQDDWGNFWTKHKSNILPTPFQPIVDFQQFSIIAVVDNEEPSGGLAIEIESITDGSGALQVQATKTMPGSMCGVTAALTQPFHIIQIDKKTLPATLNLKTIITDCSN